MLEGAIEGLWEAIFDAADGWGEFSEREVKALGEAQCIADYLAIH